MKSIRILIMPLLVPLLALALASCGPSEADLRAELHSIDRELMELRNAAYRYQSQMSQAEFNLLISSFATGYGTTSGDYQLAGDGLQGSFQSAGDYDASEYSLGQIRSRQSVLLNRRAKIVSDLN